MTTTANLKFDGPPCNHRDRFTVVPDKARATTGAATARVVFRLHAGGAATQTTWDRASSLAPPTPQEAKRWATFLASLRATKGADVVAAAYRAWDRIVEVAPGTSLPIVLPLGEGAALRLSWATARHRFDVDLSADGKLEWFFRDRTTNECAGTDGEADVALPEKAIEYLRRFA